MDSILTQEEIDYKGFTFVFDECDGFEGCESDSEKRRKFIE
jgi:ATP-dependent RNA circularization protein (DNA/RNA ligase family)